MREALAVRAEQRGRFNGTFVRFGTKRGWHGRQDATVLLEAIRDHAGMLVADHCWFNKTKALAALDLIGGDRISFEARVTLYEKGYKGPDARNSRWKPVEWDYRLDRPTHVAKIGPETTGSLWPERHDVPGHRDHDLQV